MTIATYSEIKYMESKQQKTAIPSNGAKPSRRGVPNADHGSLVTLHKYADKTGLIKAGPTYRRGFANWRASGKRAD